MDDNLRRESWQCSVMLSSKLKKVVPRSLVNVAWHLPKALLANILYGFPAQKIKVIAIAGTKGKTTTTYLTAQLLEASGERVALCSTALVKIGEDEQLNDLKMTTPSVFYLQGFLRKAVNAGCTYAVLEVSSHALKQFRVWGVPFEVVVLTNLSPDHLEYHKDARDYAETHWRLFGAQTRTVVLNGEDPDVAMFKEAAAKKVMVGTTVQDDLAVQNIHHEQGFMMATVHTQGQSMTLRQSLPGEFNIWNTAMALGVMSALGKDVRKAVEATTTLKSAPGRMETLTLDAPFSIVVDYAHSPASLEKFFAAVKPFVSNHLWVVMGACGERDPVQRPIMGRLLAESADGLIVTNDDPYGEDPEQIANQLIQGIQQAGRLEAGKSWWKVLDRRQAILQAMSMAGEGDVVAILGKGAEQWQVFADKKIPWDDRRIAAEAWMSIKKEDTV